MTGIGYKRTPWGRLLTIQDIARAHPTAIWKKHRNGTGVDYASFSAYFNGAKEAVAILLSAGRRVGPITIDQLREIRERFHPPQVLTRLTASEAQALRGCQACRHATVDIRNASNRSRGWVCDNSGYSQGSPYGHLEETPERHRRRLRFFQCLF